MRTVCTFVGSGTRTRVLYAIQREVSLAAPPHLTDLWPSKIWKRAGSWQEDEHGAWLYSSRSSKHALPFFSFPFRRTCIHCLRASAGAHEWPTLSELQLTNEGIGTPAQRPRVRLPVRAHSRACKCLFVALIDMANT